MRTGRKRAAMLFGFISAVIAGGVMTAGSPTALLGSAAAACGPCAECVDGAQGCQACMIELPEGYYNCYIPYCTHCEGQLECPGGLAFSDIGVWDHGVILAETDEGGESGVTDLATRLEQLPGCGLEPTSPALGVALAIRDLSAWYRIPS